MRIISSLFRIQQIISRFNLRDWNPKITVLIVLICI